MAKGDKELDKKNQETKETETDKSNQNKDLLIDESEINLKEIEHYSIDPNAYHRSQKILKHFIRYLSGIAPSFFFGTYVLPAAPLPYSTLIAFAAMNVNVLIGDLIHAALSKKDPLAYLRKVGEGKISSGLVIETAKFLGALLPVVAAGYGLGVIIQQYDDQLDQSAIDNPALHTIDQLLMHNLITQVLIFGGSSMLAFAGVKKVIECRLPPPKIAVEIDPPLHIAQHLATLFAGRPLNAVLLFESMRVALIATGQEALTRDWRIASLVVAIDQMMQGLGHFAHVPHPFDAIGAETQAGYERLGSDPETGHSNEAGNALALQSPSAGQKFVAGTGRVLIGLAVIFSAHLLNTAFYQLRDKKEEDMSTGERFAYEAALVVSAGLLLEGVRNTPQAVRWIGAKFCTMFGGSAVKERSEEQTKRLLHK